MRSFPFAAVFVVLTSAPLLSSGAATDATWPQFRGPNSSGVAAKGNPPVEISPKDNVLWHTEVPWSPASPAVWGDQIFLATFDGGQLQTVCYNAKDGHLNWSAGIKPDKLETFHNSEGSPAAATPATDGRHVVSYFGSFGLVGYDINGKEIWRHPLPVAQSGGGFGSGTSPIIVGETVLLNRDQEENSSVLAVSVATGKTIWESPRPGAGGSFGTPIIWKNNDVDEVVMPGSVRLKGYDLKTGQERWTFQGVTSFACTTPVVGDGLLFFAGWAPGKSDSPFPPWEKFLEMRDKNKDGVITFDEFDPSDRDFARAMDRDHDGKITKADWDLVLAQNAAGENVMVAIKPGGQGNITESHLAWKLTRGLPYVASPLYYDGRVYIVRDGGMVTSIEAKTGHPVYTQERLKDAVGSYYASPVAAAGHIYFVSQPGKLTVIKAGGINPDMLYQADFGERIFATPAIVGNRIYLRTLTKLYAFGPAQKN